MFSDVDGDVIWWSTPTNKILEFTINFDERLTESIQGIDNIDKEDNKVLAFSLNSINKLNSHDGFGKISISSNLEETIIENNESKNTTKDFSMRNDVLNKASLRRMKKYYAGIFKQKNSKIVKARFRNVRSSEMIEAVKNTFKSMFETEDISEDFYYYLMGIIKLK